MQSLGIGDTAFFGPEAEFFVFDDVKFYTASNNMFYKIDESEGPYNSGREFEGGNTGHRPPVKCGYFPVPPVDSHADLRAEMLSIMLGLGVVSRITSGFIADRIGGLGTLLIGSTLQCAALIFYIPFYGLVSLYVVSALFGLAQGGIVPSYALIVRQYFPAREAGTRVSLVLMTTVIGMAIGGWMSGEIYDLTG